MKVYMLFLIQDATDALFRKLHPRVIPVRGIVKQGAAVMEMLSEVEGRTRVIASSAMTLKSVIIRKARISGRCPHVMLSREGVSSLRSVLISRSVPEATREQIVRAWVRELTFWNRHQSSLIEQSGKCLWTSTLFPVLIMWLRFQGSNVCRDWPLPPNGRYRTARLREVRSTISFSCRWRRQISFASGSPGMFCSLGNRVRCGNNFSIDRNCKKLVQK